MLFRFLYRCATEVSWRLLFKAAWLWCGKGFFALRAFKKRNKKGIQFPPFLFFSLTNRCNLRCRGCWVEQTTDGKSQQPEDSLPPSLLPSDSIEQVIKIAQKESVYFYTLLGGEPFLAPKTLWNTIKNHPEAYFQIITNGHFFDEVTVRQHFPTREH
jgi:MoaA/NifB/PqqE/SkfB family radical SAM enzyme